MSSRTKLKDVPLDWERALAVVAHPDDMEYGAAGAVASWTAQRKDVRYAIVTRGEAGIDSTAPEAAGLTRVEEERASAAVVGVTAVEFMEYPDGMVEYGLPLRRDLARAIRRHRPEVIISLNPHLTWEDSTWNTPDHRAVGMAVVDAVRDSANRWVFRDLLQEELEPWRGVRFILFQGSPRPTHGVNVEEWLQAGIESLRCHKTYIDGLGREFDAGIYLRSMAEADGRLLGCHHAVSFELVPL